MRFLQTLSLKTYPSKMNVKGDIFEIDCDYVCQQCNCIAVKPHSLSFKIRSKLGVCPYSIRTAEGTKNLAIKIDRPALGSISIIQSPVKNVKVVCMFAQYSYGKPGSYYYYARNETFESRENAFSKCLEEMEMIPKDAVIAFPYKIGCGEAGGKFENYLKMIKRFAKDRDGKVIIVDNT